MRFFFFFLFSLNFLVDAQASESTMPSASTESDALEKELSKIRQMEPGMWAGKVGEELYGVVEEITNDNRDTWIKYFSIQGNPRVSGLASSMRDSSGKLLQKGSIAAGALHALAVLKHAPLRENKIYVAYLTEHCPTDWYPKRKRYSCDLSTYSASYLDEMIAGRPGHSCAQHIKMYMTIVTAKGSPVTSHMGIAATAESVLKGRPKGISATLHSWAAKVMMYLDPFRRFMITLPVPTVTKILSDILPHNFYYGTIEERNSFLKDLEEGSALLIGDYVMGTAELDFRKTPTGLKAFWEKHPPRLSVDGETFEMLDGTKRYAHYFLESQFSILESDGTPILTVKKDDSKCPWLWIEPFTDRGNRYVMVDLPAMAQAYPLFPLEESAAAAGEVRK